MKETLMLVLNELARDLRAAQETDALLAAGYRVTVFSTGLPGTPRTTTEGNLTVVRIAEPGPRLVPRYNLRAVWEARRRHADVIHGHDLPTLAAATLIAHAKRAPQIYDVDDLGTEVYALRRRPVRKLLWKALERVGIRRARVVVAINPSIARELARRYRVPEPPVMANYPAVRPAKRNDDLRQRLALGPDKLIALYQGAYMPGRGLEELIDAAPQVRGVAIVFIGYGPLEARLRSRARQRHSPVIFLPAVERAALSHVTAGADVGLVTIPPTCLSYYYASPAKLFEYFAAGLPVVAADSPELRRLVADPGLGVVTTPDVAGITAALTRLAQDRALFRRLKRNVLATRGAFTWEKEAAKLLDIYKSIAPLE